MSVAPLTSIIIPTYNRAAFLREAIASVLAQSARDFELLIVDDGSTDDTAKMCAAFGGQIHYISQAHRGVSAARNHGIRLARGRLITFLDSDDLWTPHKLAQQLAWMQQHSGMLLCYTNEIWIRHGRRVNQKLIHRKYGGWIYPYCLPRCIISPSSVLMRRELFEEIGVFDENLPVCEDYDLWLRVAARVEVGFIDEPLIIKRGGHGDQLSQSEWGSDRYRVAALLKMLADDRLNGEWRKATLAMLSQKCQILSQGFAKRSKLAEAAYYEELRRRHS
ncbi:glycosyltransferase [candidate division KSB1 bacterium]|nr:MAG: glycosyltransferase [candidate division KSB1 bacterium]MCE7945183.1 glycosyltransferase [Chlorobi bacterium CHB1]MDL1875460.1 glycosyltransferase [Cytophagia bacterium CHB2]RIK55146.1 MAG: glycosyl transferase [candidate division KSB1 bacterium]